MVHKFAKPQPISKNVVCWNQHEKFYMLNKFGENMRWWVEFSIFFVPFNMEFQC